MGSAKSPMVAEKALLAGSPIDLEVALGTIGVNPPRVARGLTRREMDSLTAVCDTLIPPINLPGGAIDDDSVLTFYQTSAAMLGTPEVVSSNIFHMHIQHAGTFPCTAQVFSLNFVTSLAIMFCIWARWESTSA